MKELALQVEENLRQHCGAATVSRLLVAVSGGLDSMVLLHVLSELALKFGWRLGVAHLDHGLRGKAGRADARQVRSVSRRLTWPFFEAQADVGALAKREKLSIEMAARQTRHEFLARTARDQGFPAIVLAHHADDQLELFFLRLLRGSGTDGLAGMRWSAPSPYARAVRLFRPLLDIPKAALRAYAAERGIAFSEDSTNTALDFQRNRIRHELLPLLRREYQPGLDQCILRSMEILSADAEYLASQARLWLRRDSAPGGTAVAFSSLPLAMQRHCLRIQLAEAGHAGDFELVERLRTEPGRRWEISPGRFVWRDSDGRVAIEKVETARFLGDSLVVDLGAKHGEASFGGIRLQWRFKAKGTRLTPPREANSEVFDADRVGRRIILRHWRPGDRFWPIGGPAEVKLQDVFTDQKVPARERRKRVLGCTESGEVFWVQGLRITECFKLTEKTRKQLFWKWDPP